MSDGFFILPKVLIFNALEGILTRVLFSEFSDLKPVE